MATMDASQVTVGSSKVTGAIWVAPKGTALPSNATAALPSTYKLLGFTSDAGVHISESSSDTAIRAWEERTEVVHIRTEYTESVSFMPIQCNGDVAKLLWGDDNVTVSSGSIVAKHHGRMLPAVAIVIETAPREGIVKRYCLDAQLTERGEQVMDGTQVDSRMLTFRAIPQADGTTMVEHTAYTS